MLSDDVVLLRPFRLSDAEEHLAGEDVEQIKWLSGGKSTIDTVKEWIVRKNKILEEGGPIMSFAIVEKKSERVVGMVEANTQYEKLDGLQKGDANISYGLYPFARGKGYVSRAVTIMCDYLKEKGVLRAVIRVNPENMKSLAVPKRCGFTRDHQIIAKDGEKLILFYRTLT